MPSFEMKWISLKNLLEIAADASKPKEQLRAVRKARKLSLGERMDKLVDSGAVPVLVECLKREDCSHMQYEAVWALTNIASGTAEQTKKLVDANAVPPIIKLLYSPTKSVCAQAIWALGNIISDSAEYRGIVLEHGFLKPFLCFIKKKLPTTFLRTASWVLTNLCRDNESPPPLELTLQLMPALYMLVQHKDLDVVLNCVCAISFLARASVLYCQLIIENNIVPILVRLLGVANAKLQHTALRSLGDIVCGTDEQTDVVLYANTLAYFPALLSHADRDIRKDAIWILSNIAAGTITQVQAIINKGLMMPIIAYITYGDFEIKKDALWTIRNLTFSGNTVQIFEAIKAGCIPPLYDMLDWQENQVIRLVLQSLERMLQIAEAIHVTEVAYIIDNCDGLEKLERLLYHEDNEIYNSAFEIIEKYFSNEYE